MSATRATSQLGRKLGTIADSWVKDPFRPNIQLSTFLRSLAEHPRLKRQTVDAARALQNNEVYKQFPLSDKILKPASAPHHYERLVEGVEKSAQGIGRPWWKVFFNIW